MTPTADAKLRACLLELQPLELSGMRLLKASPVGQSPLSAQIPRPQLQTAVTEIIDYTTTCQKIAQRLTKLTPIPLRNVELSEFAL